MKATINRLMFVSFLIGLQIRLLGLKVWMRERAYHALMRYSFRTGLVLGGVDLEDSDVKAAIAAAVDEATAGLKENNRKLLADLRKAKAGDNVDPAEVERLERQVEELQTQVKEANKQVKDLTKRAETAEQSLTAEQGHTHKLLIEQGLTAALLENGVKDPTMAKAAAALLRTGQKIEIGMDGENRVAKVGDKLLGAFVKEWAGSDEGKAFVAAPGHGGGGATGSNGKPNATNPFAKESFNLTAQGKLLIENPTLAKSLAAEAGVTLP